MRNAVPITALLSAGASATAPCAYADNNRLNKSVVDNVYVIQRQAGCTNQLRVDPQLQLAAQWHTVNVLNNRALDGDVGSDGSTVQSRAASAGFSGAVAETVAINPALAISGIELVNQWYPDPAIMQNCDDFTQMDVWSENSIDRTVVAAVYETGKPRFEVFSSASSTKSATR
ncbi:CAP domain-containing protein [Mycobacterium colombiense]|nr:CAP domain-containing protein [Mycobacterium colombiense]